MNRINRKYIEEYIESLSGYCGSELMDDIRKEAQKKRIPVLRKPVAKFLNVLIRCSKAKKVLEIGTCIGYSTLVILNAMGDSGKVVTIEMDEELLEDARENFKRAGVLDRVTLFLGDAGEILNFMEGEFDLIFMDGPKAQYLNYLPHCIRLLKKGGLLVCDDVLFYGMVASDRLVKRRKITIVKRMRKFLDVLTRHPLLETSVVPLGDGVSVSFKKEDGYE